MMNCIGVYHGEYVTITLNINEDLLPRNFEDLKGKKKGGYHWVAH